MMGYFLLGVCYCLVVLFCFVCMFLMGNLLVYLFCFCSLFLWGGILFFGWLGFFEGFFLLFFFFALLKKLNISSECRLLVTAQNFQLTSVGCHLAVLSAGAW